MQQSNPFSPPESKLDVTRLPYFSVSASFFNAQSLDRQRAIAILAGVSHERARATAATSLPVILAERIRPLVTFSPACSRNRGG